jgi:hypothetical protein
MRPEEGLALLTRPCLADRPVKMKVWRAKGVGAVLFVVAVVSHTHHTTHTKLLARQVVVSVPHQIPDKTASSLADLTGYYHFDAAKKAFNPP